MQGCGNNTLAAYRLPGSFTLGLHGDATRSQCFVGDGQMDAAIRDVDFNGVAFFDQTDGAAVSRFRRGMTDGKPRGATGEAAIGK